MNAARRRPRNSGCSRAASTPNSQSSSTAIRTTGPATKREIETLDGTHATSIERQLTWLAEHGDRTAALLIAARHRTAGRSTLRTDELRSSLAERDDSTASLLERDERARDHLRTLGRAPTRSLGRAGDLAIPQVDVGLDIGD